MGYQWELEIFQTSQAMRTQRTPLSFTHSDPPPPPPPVLPPRAQYIRHRRKVQSVWWVLGNLNPRLAQGTWGTCAGSVNPPIGVASFTVGAAQQPATIKSATYEHDNGLAAQHPRQPCQLPGKPDSDLASGRKQQEIKAIGNSERLAYDIPRLEVETERTSAEQSVELARSQTQPTMPQTKLKTFFMKFGLLTLLSRGRRSKCKNSQSSLITAASDDTRQNDNLSTPSVSDRMDVGEACRYRVAVEKITRVLVTARVEPVRVRCFARTVTLLVTAEMSIADSVHGLADITKFQASPETCIVIEYNGVLGLVRRLRWYECVSDVLNTWENHRLNSLMVVPRCTSGTDQDLDLMYVPRAEHSLPGFCLWLYHHSRKGRWTKRWVMLDNGRLTAYNEPSCNSSAVGQTVCHLLDCDIYGLQASVKRRIRPPAQFCYAIKSQQNISRLRHDKNLIHYFCTH
ncbi:hypothetical protein VB005_00173 [Metarhizium brunneum]